MSYKFKFNLTKARFKLLLFNLYNLVINLILKLLQFLIN